MEAEYAQLKKKGWRYLWKGLIFLAICLIISELVSRFDIPLNHLISESVIVAGWVAMWHPIEIFLYELPELKEKNTKG